MQFACAIALLTEGKFLAWLQHCPLWGGWVVNAAKCYRLR